jgi:hypothetical protein
MRAFEGCVSSLASKSKSPVLGLLPVSLLCHPDCDRGKLWVVRGHPDKGQMTFSCPLRNTYPSFASETIEQDQGNIHHPCYRGIKGYFGIVSEQEDPGIGKALRKKFLVFEPEDAILGPGALTMAFTPPWIETMNGDKAYDFKIPCYCKLIKTQGRSTHSTSGLFGAVSSRR